MNIIKNQLTFEESLQFVNGVIDSVFTQDEEGNDIDYSPASLQPLIQSTLVEMYTDYEFVEDFDTNFAEYMSINIDNLMIGTINTIQFDGMLKAINEGIEFRKQKMLQQNIKVTSILDEEIIKFANVLTEVVQNLPKNFDMKSVQPFMDKINSMGKIDEKKIVEAALNKNHSLKNKLFGFLSKKNKKSGE